MLRALTDRRAGPADPAGGLRGPLRGAGRGQPPPRGVPVLRRHRRRRLRRRRRALPDRLRRPGFVDRRGRGHLLGPLPRLRRYRSTTQSSQTAASEAHRERDETTRSDRRVSESENPAIPTPGAQDRHRPRTNQDWWPNQLDLSGPAPALARGPTRWARTSTTPRSSRSSTSRRSSATSPRCMTHLAGLVAGRLRPLRPAVHPPDLARRRHLPHRRRPRRRRRRARSASPRSTAGRTTRNLDKARRLLLAGQAEVRPEDLLGRPARPRRQRRAGGHGLQDLRLRLRPRGRLGARGDLLGPEDTWLGDERYSGDRELGRARSARSRWA